MVALNSGAGRWTKAVDIVTVVGGFSVREDRGEKVGELWNVEEIDDREGEELQQRQGRKILFNYLLQEAFPYHGLPVRPFAIGTHFVSTACLHLPLWRVAIQG